MDFHDQFQLGLRHSSAGTMATCPVFIKNDSPLVLPLVTSSSYRYPIKPPMLLEKFVQLELFISFLRSFLHVDLPEHVTDTF